MPSADIVEQVRALAARVAGTYGLDIFDVQFRREASGMVLRIRLDRPGPAATAEDSVSVDDCARVSRDLSAVLDVEDVVPTAYTLEVSSPGLDRPLRHAADYRRFSGRRAKLVMRETGGRADVLQRNPGRHRRYPRPHRRRRWTGASCAAGRDYAGESGSGVLAES